MNVCAFLLVAASVAADPVKLIDERMYFGWRFELTLTVAETGEKFQHTHGATVFDRLTFGNCFSKDGKGAFVATIRFPKTGEEFTLRTTGLTEDFYVVHYLGLDKEFAKWRKKAVEGVKESPDVKTSDQMYRLPGKAKAVDPVPSHLLPVVAAAALKYEEKRPELFLRVRGDSHLFFPPAARASWSVYRDGDRLFVWAGCSDKMYAGEFVVEFKATASGEWEYVRLNAHQWFKGE